MNANKIYKAIKALYVLTYISIFFILIILSIKFLDGELAWFGTVLLIQLAIAIPAYLITANITPFPLNFVKAKVLIEKNSQVKNFNNNTSSPSYFDNIRRVDQEVKNKSTFWEQLSPYEFEREVALLFKKASFDVKITKGSGDGGVDVIAVKEGKKIFIQCKKYKHNVGPEPVRSLYGVMAKEKIKYGIIVSLYDFSVGAMDFANETYILCFTIKNLICFDEKLIESYLSGKLDDMYFHYSITNPFNSDINSR